MSPVSSSLRLLSACASFAALVFAGGGTCAAAPSEPTSAYLMVHFTGESPRGEQIYFSVSEKPVTARYLRLVFPDDVKGSDISLIEWTVL